ncbi:unnamed protein product [Sphagnum troendelagicum]|uniref:LisH domain-containing protein n=1 Tax=Sphagnum troendelagicum TaxID=128251 RepID=A0ABP0U316_9BRYO
MMIFVGCFCGVASEELVAIAAGEWGVAVEEYLDQLQLQFSVQNPGSSFSFIPVADTITLLECSFVEEKSQLQHSVTLELEKKQRCGKVAYDILGNLLEHNSKQNDELAHKTRDILRMNAELNELKFTPKTDLNSLRSKPVDQTELQSATSLLPVLPDQDTARRLQPFITKPQQQQQQILSSGKTTGSLHEAEINQSVQQSNDTAGRKTFQKTVRHGPGDTDCRRNEAENNAATSSGRKFARLAAEVMVESHSQESEEELSSSVPERQVPYGPGAIETTTATVFTRNSSKIGPDDDDDDDDDDEHNDELDLIRTAPATSGWRRNSRIKAYDELQSETPEIQATRLLRQNLKTEADDSDFATAEVLQTTAWLRRNSKNGFDEGETQSAELKKKKKGSYTRDPEACHLDTPVIHDVPENQVPGSRRNLKNGSEELENQASALRSSYAGGVVDGSTSSNTRLVTRQLETPGILVTGSRRNSRNEFDDETQTSAGGGSRKTSLHARRINEESSRSRSPEMIQPMMPAGSMRSQRNSKIGSNESETQGAASGGGSRGSSYARFDETSNRPDSSPTEMRVTGSRRNSKIHESINDTETRALPQTRKDSYVRIDESSWSDIIPEAQVTTGAAAGSRRNSRNEFDDELETTQAPGGGSRRSSSSARPQHESTTSRPVDDSHEMIRISRRNSMRNELDDDDADELDEALASGSRKNFYASPEAASRRRDSKIEVDDEMDMQISRLKRNSHATTPVFDNSRNNSSSRPQSPEIIQASSGRRDSRNRFKLDNETEKRRRSSSTTRRRSSSNDARFVDESSSPPAAATSEKQQISASRRRNSRNEEGDSDEAEDYEEEEAQGSSGFVSRRSSPYVGLRDASDEMPQTIPEKQVQQAARRNSRNNGFDDEIPETRTKSRSRTNSRSRNSASSHARLLDDDDESSRQRRWTENSPDLQFRRKNSRTTSEESFGEDHETQGSRNSLYVRRVDQQSSRQESPEKMQGPRRNSRNGFDEPETHASAAARRSSFARLDESNSSMNPDESPKVQAASRRETFSRNEFDEMQGVSGLKRSSYVNDSRSSETPEISRAISSGGSRRESTKNNTGFAVGGGVDHLRSSAALSEAQGTTTSSGGSRRNSKIVFNEPERNLYTAGGGGVAADDESGMLDTHEQIHQVVVAAAAASRRNSQNAFDELETPQQSSAAGFRRNSSSSAIQPDGESPTTTAEIQTSGSRRHSHWI